jgi:uncharacterized protein (TIGR00369 family)
MTRHAVPGRYRCGVDSVPPIGPPPNRAEQHAPLDEVARAPWANFAAWDEPYLPSHLGLTLEEMRADYARMRLPWSAEVRQPDGMMHGGAIATLLDTVVVPAIASAYTERIPMSTISMTVNYRDKVVDCDAIAEGWVERRGRSIVFCRAEVMTDAGTVVADASVVYRIWPS